MTMGWARYGRDFHPSRLRGCISNQYSIDKCLGVWESQNVRLPVDFDYWVELCVRAHASRPAARGRCAGPEPGLHEGHGADRLRRVAIQLRAKLVCQSAGPHDVADGPEEVTRVECVVP